MYLKNKDNVLLETGDNLSELTNEIEVGDEIVEFVSTGLKSYSYLTKKGKKICKVKGFTLNYRNDKVLSFHAMKDIVLGDTRKTVTTLYPHQIKRNLKKLF